MTLYRNFPSKDDLILDFLQRREQLWTREWLQADGRRGVRPQEQLLAIFDIFSEWFQPTGLRRLRLPHDDDRSQ